MGKSVYRKLFERELICPLCGNRKLWALDGTSGSIYCYAPHPSRPDDICGFAYKGEDLFSADELKTFNHLRSLTRLFRTK